MHIKKPTYELVKQLFASQRAEKRLRREKEREARKEKERTEKGKEREDGVYEDRVGDSRKRVRTDE